MVSLLDILRDGGQTGCIRNPTVNVALYRTGVSRICIFGAHTGQDMKTAHFILIPNEVLRDCIFSLHTGRGMRIAD